MKSLPAARFLASAALALLLSACASLPEAKVREVSVPGAETLTCRAFEGVSYLRRPPAPHLQKLNLYLPIADGSPARLPVFVRVVQTDHRGAGPVFVRGRSVDGAALAHGFAVCSVGVRGFDTVEGEGPREMTLPKGVGPWTVDYVPPPAVGEEPPPRPTGGLAATFDIGTRGPVVGPDAASRVHVPGRHVGRAPAAALDLKAAIRWIRANADRFGLDAGRIVLWGESSGGGLAVLAAASGGHPDYEDALEALGAEKESDAVFAVAAFAPATDFAHADAAYEFSFGGIRPPRDAEKSRALADEFASYVESPDFGLSAAALREKLDAALLESARRAARAGARVDVARTGVDPAAGRVDRAKFLSYLAGRSRLRPCPAYDAPKRNAPENELFGGEGEEGAHFTSRALRGETGEEEAELDRATASRVRAVDAVGRLLDGDGDIAPRWFLRIGSVDTEVAPAAVCLLAEAARKAGSDVDFALGWNRAHGEDCDRDAFFTWIDRAFENPGPAGKPE